MPKIKTPLLRPLRKQGTTLYTFPSASEDIALNINSGTQGVAMSHYALLNLTKNNFNFKNTTEIVLSLQNWMMNSEVVLLNQPTYNFQESKTVTERVFWNWIKSNSKTPIFSEVQLDTDIYREVNYQSSNKDRLVQCFGAIDAGNHLSTEFGMFNETYINIPTSYGNGPVFFESCKDDSNYRRNVKYNTGSCIQGRELTDRTYLPVNNGLVPSIAEYSDSRSFEIVKDIQAISRICKKLPGAATTMSIESYDDINIDSDNQFDRISGLAINSNECKFKFNAILLYYSIYDMNDVNKDAVATNLFGIIFLDGGANGEDNDYLLAPVIKKKSYRSQNSVTSYFGNGYSFRVNVKTLSVYDNTDAIIQDNTTSTSLYAQDFSDIISNLNKAIDIMNVNVNTTSAIQNKYVEIFAQYIEMQNKIKELENNLTNELQDRMDATLKEFEERYRENILELKAELGITEDDIADPGFKLSNDSDNILGASRSGSQKTPLLLQPILRHLYPQLKSEISNRLGYGISTMSDNDSGVISDTQIDIMSATDANINAERNINITGSEFNFNYRNGDKIHKIKLSDILDRLNTVEKNIEEGTYNEVSSEEKLPTINLDYLKNLPVIQIIDILPPRAKKPEVPGLYFKKNTAGEIVQYVLFDGEEYVETIKCVSGKMYLVNGEIYVFDGEKCKLLGV